MPPRLAALVAAAAAVLLPPVVLAQAPETVTLRRVKGSPLVNDEVDDNFENFFHLFTGADSTSTPSGVYGLFPPAESGLTATDCDEASEAGKVRIDLAEVGTGGWWCTCNGASGWVCGGGASNEVTDSDSDTAIEVERTADDDTIRFKVLGTDVASWAQRVVGEFRLDASLDADSEVLLPLKADAATPTLAFGDGDAGLYELADDQLAVALGGSQAFEFKFSTDSATGPFVELLDLTTAPSGTPPSDAVWCWADAGELRCRDGSGGTIVLTDLGPGDASGPTVALQYEPEYPPPAASCNTCDEFPDEGEELTWRWQNQQTSTVSLETDRLKLTAATEDEATDTDLRVRWTTIPSTGDWVITTRLNRENEAAFNRTGLILLSGGTEASPTELHYCASHQDTTLSMDREFFLVQIPNYTSGSASVLANTGAVEISDGWPTEWLQLRYDDSEDDLFCYFSDDGVDWELVGSDLTVTAGASAGVFGHSFGTSDETTYFDFFRLRTDSAGLAGKPGARVTLSEGSLGNRLQDTDNDTFVEVEETADADEVVISTAGVDRVTVTATGNVGIGTGAPPTLLFAQGSGGTELIQVKSTALNSVAGFRLANDTQTYTARVNSADGFDIRDETAGETPFKIIPGAVGNSVYIDDSGGAAPQIGIGTANPQGAFHLQKFAGEGTPTFTAADTLIVQANAAATSFVNLAIVGGSTADLGLSMGDVGDYDELELKWRTDDRDFGVVIDGNRVVDIEAGAPASSIYVDSAGEVGIGTAAPATTLDIRDPDASAAVVNLRAAASQVAVYRLEPSSVGRQWDIEASTSDLRLQDQTASTSPLILEATAPNNSIRADASGDVLLGDTTARVTGLTVRPGGDAGTVPSLTNDGAVIANTSAGADVSALYVLGGTGGSARLHFGNSSTANEAGLDYDNANQDMAIRAASGERAIVHGGGLLIGSDTAGHTGTNVLSLVNGSAPTTSQTNGVLLYSKDVSTSAELHVRDEAGNETPLSPHAITRFAPHPDCPHPWAFASSNDYLGARVEVDMCKLAILVEQLTGETIIHEELYEPKPWDQETPPPPWLVETLENNNRRRLEASLAALLLM